MKMKNEQRADQYDLMLSDARAEVLAVLSKYFFDGNVEHHVGLLSNAIQEVVQRGSDETDASLDNPFGFTRRYIRESVYDLTELQKFLLRLSVVYSHYQRKRSKIALTDTSVLRSA